MFDSCTCCITIAEQRGVLSGKGKEDLFWLNMTSLGTESLSRLHYFQINSGGWGKRWSSFILEDHLRHILPLPRFLHCTVGKAHL